jgi:chemotaxis protein methyltransferase CheR
MMLDEISPNRQHSILATDFDQGALAKARAGGPYQIDEVKFLTKAQFSAYFKTGGPPHFLNVGSIGRKIQFKEHNMLEDMFPQGIDLIVCRNVVIYFTGAAKEQLYQNFSNALRPGGILFVGATEIIPHPANYNLKGAGISFYQKGS